MPQIKTKTYAQILEMQGFKEEALAIYEELAKINPDREILEAIERLKKRQIFEGVNLEKLKEFDNINSENRFKFEKWLSEL